MTEHKEFYKKYGIKPTEHCTKCFRERYHSLNDYKKDLEKAGCSECYNGFVFHEITADKILKLEDVLPNFAYKPKERKYITLGTKAYESEGKTRLNALLNLMVKLYDHLSESERQQVKEIIEG
jgi:hypothetical protein